MSDRVYPDGASEEDKISLDEEADRLDLERDIAMSLLPEVRCMAEDYVAANPTATVLGCWKP